jgi:WD40 repeat protein
VVIIAALGELYVVTSLFVVEQINSPPNDGISSLAFSPKANYLVATSWDNQVMPLAYRISVFDKHWCSSVFHARVPDSHLIL